MPLPTDSQARATWLIDRLGGHLSRRLGIDLDPEPDDATLVRWLIATCLVAPRADERRVAAAFEQLFTRDLVGPQLAETDPLAIEAALVEARHPRPPETTLVLVRAVGAATQGQDSLRQLLASAESLEELGGQLSRLSPGFGRAAVTRFLQPLRESWPVCADLPLDPAAVAAAIHLDLLPPESDPESSTATLRRNIAAPDPGAPLLRDLEAALQRLGRQACQRNRFQACPLADHCPQA